MEIINTIGRRKAAIARIYVKEGKGKFLINNRTLENYFPTVQLQHIARQPLTLLSIDGKYDITANITGGGTKGQAEALRLAVSRALVEINPEDKSKMRNEGFLTRDSRVVERKKPGQPKARKRFQFSKR